MTVVRAQDPFFIVGVGRSGTTLVRSILNAHSNICVPPETHFLKRVAGDRAEGREAPTDFEAFWTDLARWSRFLDLGVEPEAVLARITAAGDHRFATIFTALLRAYAAREGKPRVGEKTPSHYRQLETIFDWFPAAKIIVVRRDPRDVVASQLRSPWVHDEMSPGRLSAPVVRRLRLFHVAERARNWNEAYGRFLQTTPTDDRFFLIVYEELVRDPAGVVERLCAFLGEPFEPSMLVQRSGGALAAPQPDRRWQAWRAAHAEQSNAPITRSSVGRGRDALRPHELALVEGVCGPLMERCGYEAKARSPLTRVVGNALVSLDRFEEQVRRNRAVRALRRRVRRRTASHSNAADQRLP